VALKKMAAPESGPFPDGIDQTDPKYEDPWQKSDVFALPDY
jgi:hypothetical protein